MRAIGLAMIAIQVGLTVAGKAETPAEPDRSITDVLPLFVKNRCEDIRNPADQMFCGDPDLNAVGVKLNAAIAERLNRIPNHNLAVVENAEWIREPLSCGGRLASGGRKSKRQGRLRKETKEKSVRSIDACQQYDRRRLMVAIRVGVGQDRNSMKWRA
jgi:hypothetical protein